MYSGDPSPRVGYGNRSSSDQIQTIATSLHSNLAPYPDLYHAGYTQDALKELVEAYTTYAIIRDQPLPTPEALNVPSATYLNGLAEAATELRRFILDIMRKEVHHSSRGRTPVRVDGCHL
jgi:predicted translin family RNA/ssDNA-binding protein